MSAVSIIPFNHPHLSGKEPEYILEAVRANKLSGNGIFTKRCQQYLEQRYTFHKVLLTTSCTDALEMAAILLNIEQGDEVIMPSYTFVSTANAFVLRGAKVVFADSRNDHPGMDEGAVEALITPKTKAIVVVHYAGVACDMDVIMDIADRHGLKVVEDAAQAIASSHKSRPLGGIGHMGTYSFHETKNIQCGEGGALMVNDPSLMARAEIIWEKGTNRAAFWRGEVDKYNWVDVGSSFLPSEINAAYLFAQLENLEAIQGKRLHAWGLYRQLLQPAFASGRVTAPSIPDFATNNAHMFYLVCDSGGTRDKLMAYLKERGIHAVFHYQSLHASPFYGQKHDGRELPETDRYSECLLRLPLYCDINEEDVQRVAAAVNAFFN